MDISKLKGHVPDAVIAQIPEVMDKFQINTPLGRGYIQLTGKDNYSAFDKVVTEDITANPDLVATKYPLLSAAWFWNSRKLNEIADKGATDAEVTAITKKVNGGTIGLADRIKHFKEFYELVK